MCGESILIWSHWVQADRGREETFVISCAPKNPDHNVTILLPCGRGYLFVIARYSEN